MGKTQAQGPVPHLPTCPPAHLPAGRKPQANSLPEAPAPVHPLCQPLHSLPLTPGVTPDPAVQWPNEQNVLSHSTCVCHTHTHECMVLAGQSSSLLPTHPQSPTTYSERRNMLGGRRGGFMVRREQVGVGGAPRPGRGGGQGKGGEGAGAGWGGRGAGQGKGQDVVSCLERSIN